MSRSIFALVAALSMSAAMVGCTQCDTCDDFPLPCNGPNCGFQGDPSAAGLYANNAPGAPTDVALIPPQGQGDRVPPPPVVPVPSSEVAPVSTSNAVEVAPDPANIPPAEITPPSPTSADADQAPQS